MERKWFLLSPRHWAYATLPKLSLLLAEYTPTRSHPLILVIRTSRKSLFRHALGRQLFFGTGVLGELGQAHAAQHVGRLGELDVVVAHDLDPVAPRISEIEEAARQHLDLRRLERTARRLLVVDHQAEMAAIVGRLLAAFLEGDELVAQVDEGHGLALAAQLELEQPAVEGQRLLDVADLERHVVEADNARLFRFRHGTPSPLVRL